jgi:hypothetical protein
MSIKSSVLISALIFSGLGALAGAYLASQLIAPDTQLSTAKSSSATSAQRATQDTRGNAPLYITTMTHMEGNVKDDEIQASFQKHAADVRWAMNLFDEYGARLTIETERPFALGNTTWNDNVLADVIAQGHGVGTHADFGANSRKILTVAELVTAYTENKKLVDDLVGAEHNLGVSGGIGPTDWVLAASEAGFSFMTGVTGFAYLSMDEGKRPDGWTNEYIRNVTYHDGIPVEFSERIYPLQLTDATDFENDEDSVITVMGGEIGELPSLAEGRSNCFPGCTFDADDIAVVEAAILEADEIRGPSKFAKINMHIPLSLLVTRNETLLRDLLSMIQRYADDGTVIWGTQKESYEAFVEWEKGER